MIIAQIKRRNGQITVDDNGQIKTIVLTGPQFTGKGVAFLKDLSKPSSLSLNMSRVGEDGIAYTGGLTGLTEFYLARSQITDASLQHRKRLKNRTMTHAPGVKSNSPARAPANNPSKSFRGKTGLL